MGLVPNMLVRHVGQSITSRTFVRVLKKRPLKHCRHIDASLKDAGIKAGIHLFGTRLL
jgi:hypothetical protein